MIFEQMFIVQSTIDKVLYKKYNSYVENVCKTEDYNGNGKHMAT